MCLGLASYIPLPLVIIWATYVGPRKYQRPDALHGTSDTLGQYEILNGINCGQYQTLTGTKPWLDTYLHLNSEPVSISEPLS
jgi:hypothetical protein